MKALVEKSTGRVLGFWPNEQGVMVSGTSDETHEFVEAPPGAAYEEVHLYTRVSPGQFAKAEKISESKALEDAIVARVEARLAAKGGK